MKKAILSALIIFLVFGCGSKKKIAETEEKTEIKKDSTSIGKVEKETEKETVVKKNSEDTKTTTETTVKYTPKINSTTGKFEPFKMDSKKNGKTDSSIEINGNGEVIIKTLLENNKKESEEIRTEIEKMKDEFMSQIKTEQEKNSELNSKLKEVSGSVWKLWMWIVILAVLLAISIYFHVVRTGIPFMNK